MTAVRAKHVTSPTFIFPNSSLKWIGIWNPSTHKLKHTLKASCSENRPNVPSYSFKIYFRQLLNTAKRLPKLTVFLPKHTRPVPSSVSPSGHSQWNEPLLLTHRPLGQTPGKTSHSFTSVGKGKGWKKFHNVC